MANDTLRQRDEDMRRWRAIETERRFDQHERSRRAWDEHRRQERYRQQRADEARWRQSEESRRNAHS